MKSMFLCINVMTMLVADFTWANTPVRTETQPIPASTVGPVPQTPPIDDRDSPEEIAKDAERDLKDSRFYNKPGATRADYNADWQKCRLIARGSRTPSGYVSYAYNPNVISPYAAAVGAGIGSAIAQAIIEGRLRRENRRRCLMYNGWRKVEVAGVNAARVAAMTDAQRDAYFDTVVGAQTVDGIVTEETVFQLLPDPALKLDAPVGDASTLIRYDKVVDPKAPFALAADEGLLIIAFARPDAATAGRSGQLSLYRYNKLTGDLIYRPRDWKKKGDLTTYSFMINSKDRKASYEIQVIKLTAGDYVIGTAHAGKGLPAGTHCFGAPMVTVPAGGAVYAGDWFPFVDVRLSTGTTLGAQLGWKPHLDRLRQHLAKFQPKMAEGVTMADMHNGASFGCSATLMTKWDLPGLPPLDSPMAAPADTASAAGAVVK